MPEKLNPSFQDTPGQFAITAITLANATDAVIEAAKGQPHEVQLLINGVEVPFATTINDWWRRCEEELNERAAIMAMDKFEELNKIGDFLSDFKFQIRQRVEEVFGVTLRDE